MTIANGTNSDVDCGEVLCEMDCTVTPNGLMDIPCGKPAETIVRMEGVELDACLSCAKWLANQPRSSVVTVELPDSDGEKVLLDGTMAPFWRNPIRDRFCWIVSPDGIFDSLGRIWPAKDVRAVALAMLAASEESDRLCNRRAVASTNSTPE